MQINTSYLFAYLLTNIYTLCHACYVVWLGGATGFGLIGYLAVACLIPGCYTVMKRP